MANAVPRITLEMRKCLQVLGLEEKLDERLGDMNHEQLRQLIVRDPDGEGFVVSNYQVCKKFKALILQQIWWRVICPILVIGAVIVFVLHVTGKLSGSSTSSLNSSGTLNDTLPSTLEPTEAAPTFFNYDQDVNKLKNISRKQQDSTQPEILFVPIKSTSTAVFTTPTARPEPDVPETAVSASELPNYLSSSTPQPRRVCSEYDISEFYHPFRDDYQKKCNSTIVSIYHGVMLKLVTCTQCVFTEATIKSWKNLGLVQNALMKADVLILDNCHASQKEASLDQLNNLDLPNLKHLLLRKDQVEMYSCEELIKAISTWRAPILTLDVERVNIQFESVGIFQRFFNNFALTVQTLSIRSSVFCWTSDPFKHIMFPKLEKVHITESRDATRPRLNTVTKDPIISIISCAPNLKEFNTNVPLTLEDLNNILNNPSSNLKKATFNIRLSTSILHLKHFSKFPRLNDLLLIVSLGDNILDRVSVVGFELFAEKDFHMTIESVKTFQFLVDSFEFKQYPNMLKISPNNQTITWTSTGDAHMA